MSKSAAPQICPECRFANKSTSTQCDNCGAILQGKEHESLEIDQKLKYTTKLQSPPKMILGVVLVFLGIWLWVISFLMMVEGRAFILYFLIGFVGLIPGVLYYRDAFERQLAPERSKPSAPRICPECRFANKSTSTQCDNCGAIFQGE